MKKVRKSTPLAVLSVLLASCADARTPSVTDGIDDQGSTEQSENTENELSSRLEELSAGFDIDMSVDGENHGRFALEENGVTVGFSGEDSVYYIPEEGEKGETCAPQPDRRDGNESLCRHLGFDVDKCFLPACGR